MGNNSSTPNGGISTKYPVGTLVRVKLPVAKEKEFLGEESSEESTDEEFSDKELAMNGRIGVVCGGDADEDRAHVCLSSKIHKWGSFKSEWLEEVLDADELVVKKFEKILWKSVRLEARGMIHSYKQKSENTDPALKFGTFVQCKLEIGDLLQNAIGVLLGDGDDCISLVTFGKPFYSTYFVQSKSVESFDIDEIMDEQKKLDLYKVKDIVLMEKFRYSHFTANGMQHDLDKLERDKQHNNIKMETHKYFFVSSFVCNLCVIAGCAWYYSGTLEQFLRKFAN